MRRAIERSGRAGLCAALAVVAAAALAGCPEDQPDYASWTKQIAAEKGGRSGDVDVCQANAWYGDGACDTFCPAPDTADCKKPSGVCSADADCGANEACDTSQCLSCCPDAPAGSSCVATCCGTCKPKKPAYTACFGNQDCLSPGEVCDQSTCLSCCPDAAEGTPCIAACCGKCAPAPTKACAADADCASGAEWCLDGKCAPCDNGGLVCKIACKNGMVAPRNGCQPCECKPDYVACMGDAQCGAGEVCNPSECLSCCPDAAPGAPCVAACCGRCEPAPTKTCRADADCTSGGEWCEGGKCVPCDNSGTACMINCLLVDPRNGCQPCKCRGSYEACMGDSQCGAGDLCDLSECLSCCPDAAPGTPCVDACCGKCAPAPTKTCTADADCAAGSQWCEAGKCVPCDNSGLACFVDCILVEPRNGCQPCQCKPTYEACMSDQQCAATEVCDLTLCLSCCPDAAPGTPCVDACCGKCAAAPTKTCSTDAECTSGGEWCEGGKCVPCDNSGVVCDIACANGLVDARNGCQPCRCKPSYEACMGDAQCGTGKVCDLSACLSCCPDAEPGSACVGACCGQCVTPPTKTCATDAECTAGAQWCEAGKCVPCDNSGTACMIACLLVDPRNGCQPCQCKPSYVPCLDAAQCGSGGTCDTSTCLSCCPDAAPGTTCVDTCCGKCQ